MRLLCRDPGARANLGDSRFAVIVNNRGCLERRARSKAKCGSKTPGFAMARCQKWNLFAEVEARGNDASDQPRTAIEGEVLDRSLDKNQNHLWNVTRYVRRMKAQTSHAGKPEIWHRKPRPPRPRGQSRQAILRRSNEKGQARWAAQRLPKHPPRISTFQGPPTVLFPVGALSPRHAPMSQTVLP